jgi:sterol desaturase/sphingolipid hydroxylase (fatty acid hydroxylase superfamily)
MTKVIEIFNLYIEPHLFFYLLGLYLILESFFTLNKRQKLIGSEAKQNAGWVIINDYLLGYVSQGLMFILNISFIPVFWANYISPNFQFADSIKFKIDNVVILTIVVFVSRDFISWSIHRLLHKNKFLWKFHMLHHSSTHIDALAGFRGNWLENLLFDTFLAIPLIVFDVPPAGFALVGLWELHMTFFIHSNINLRKGGIWKYLTSPLTHHWHHAEYCHFKQGQNFGGYSTLFDRLFGTYYCPDELPEKYGFKDLENYPKNIVKRFFYPLVK